MAMEINNNYSSYVTRNVESKPPVDSTTADYAKDLSKLVPSVDFKVGYGVSAAKSGTTLTINPKLIEKMQNDPAQAKDTKDLLRGVESAINLIDSINKATGWTTTYRHSYIDENGKYHSSARTVKNEAMLKLSDKLRAERRKMSDELLERAKETAAENRNKLNAPDNSSYSKIKQFIEDKINASKDGTININDADMRTIIDASKDTGNASVTEHSHIGKNLDLKA